MRKKDTKIQILQRIEHLVVWNSIEINNKIVVPLEVIRGYLEQYYNLLKKKSNE